MRHIPVDELTIDHIRALHSEGAGEARHLEYKREAPGGRDGEKKEFLADVSSFANAGGGDLLFGVEGERRDGKPTGRIAAISGLPGFNEDADVQRLLAIVRDGVSPRIPGVHPRVVPGGDSGPVFVIRVARSWIGPHMVTFGGSSRFFSRTNAGKYQLDVQEIRAAVLGSEKAADDVRRFRNDRLAKIIADETPVSTGNGPRWAMHIVPVDAFSSVGRDVVVGGPPSVLSDFRAIRMGGSWSDRHNIDGLLVNPGSPTEEEVGTYALLFRSGAIEAVEAGLFVWPDRRHVVPAVIERYIIEAAQGYVRLLRRLGVDAPLATSVSLLGVRGLAMGAGQDVVRPFGDPTFDRDDVFLPEILLNGEDVSAASFRPLLDVLWQAAGWSKSPYFDAEGNWTLPAR